MSKVVLSLLSLSLLILSSCGVSGEKQERMKNSIYVAVTDAFLAQDAFTAFSPSVELSDIEKGGAMGWNCAYHGSVYCSFDCDGSHISMSGVAGFSEDGCVATLPNGSLAVFFPSVLVNNERVNSDTSIYNLSCFGR